MLLRRALRWTQVIVVPKGAGILQTGLSNQSHWLRPWAGNRLSRDDKDAFGGSREIDIEETVALANCRAHTPMP